VAGRSAVLPPVAWMVLTSPHSEPDAGTNPPAFTAPLTLSGYREFFGASTGVNPLRPLLNAATASLASTLLVLLLAIPAAYALSIRSVRSGPTCCSSSSPPRCCRLWPGSVSTARCRLVAHLRVAQPDGGDRVRDVGLGLVPLPHRGGVLARQHPCGLPGRPVRDVLRRRGHQHRAAESRGREFAHGLRPRTAAHQQHPLRLRPLVQERVEPIGEPAQQAPPPRRGPGGTGSPCPVAARRGSPWRPAGWGSAPPRDMAAARARPPRQAPRGRAGRARHGRPPAGARWRRARARRSACRPAAGSCRWHRRTRRPGRSRRRPAWGPRPRPPWRCRRRR